MTVINILLEITIYSVVLFGAIWLFRALLKKHLSPVMLYAMWFLLIARLLMPVTISAGFSVFVIPAEETPAVAGEIVDFGEASEAPIVDSSAYKPNGFDVEQTEDERPQAFVQAESLDAITAATASNTLDFKISWEAALVALWLAGAAVMLAGMGVSTIKLKAKISTANPISDSWQQIANEIKQGLGIKRDIRIVMIEGFPSPALTMGIKPTVVLPEELLHKDEENVRFALLHEMMHIKRRDHIVSMLLLVLRSVYWFNPIVWLTVRQMRLDMESACDSMLTGSMSRQTKRQYAGTMLSMYADTQVRYVLGMALGQTKKTAERRLKSMFMRSKTSRRGRITALLLACALLVACFTTACQPTPEEPVVMNKNTDLVEDVVAANSESNAADWEEDKQTIAEQINAADGHLTMQITPGDQVTIDVDADIVIPEFDQLPMVRLKPKNFSQEQFNAFIEYLTDGLPVYYKEMSPNAGSFTKEEIMAIQTKIRGYLANEDLPGNIRSPWEYRMGEMDNEYVSAISQADEELYDGTLTVPENKEEKVVQDNGVVAVYGKHDPALSRTSLKCYMGKSRAAWLNMNQTQEGNRTQMTFDNNDYGSAYNTFEPYEGVDAVNIDMTYEEAKAMAEDFARTIDGEDSSLVIYQSSIGYELESIAGYSKETSPNAYVFNFARSCDGALVKHIGYLSGANENIDYNKRVLPERLFVIIDDGGIVDAYWTNHTEYVENVASDVPLKDFDTVKETFENYCRYKFTWTYRNDGLAEDTTPAVTLKVKRIEMNFMVIPEKDNLESYIMVPVWDFIADMTLDEEQMSQEGFLDEGQRDVSILTINAIDGTVIDREQGY